MKTFIGSVDGKAIYNIQGENFMFDHSGFRVVRLNGASLPFNSIEDFETLVSSVGLNNITGWTK